MDPFLVAIVEDDVSVLESLQGLLESTGYEVVLYPSAEDFLNSDRLQDITCLISDVGLPGMDGIELLRAVKLRRAGLPVILITARNEPNLWAAALKSGARQVFKKPIDTAALLDSIESAR